MFKLKSKKSGFTLVEMLIAMTIFLAFIAILMSSYGSIVKAQRQANEYREVYSEAREIFETLVGNLREGMVDYAFYKASFLNGKTSDLRLISKDGRTKTIIKFDHSDGILRMEKGTLAQNQEPKYEPVYEKLALNSALKIRDFKFYVSPSIDPYDLGHVEKDLNQFHPKVTIYAVFAKELNNDPTFEFALQTTISSRIYNQVYDTDY